MITIDCPRENCLINERGKIERTEESGRGEVTRTFYSCAACGGEWLVTADASGTRTETMKERREV
jgi:hypothetical protein